MFKADDKAKAKKEEKSLEKGEAQVDQSASDRLDPMINVQDPVKAPFVAQPVEGEPTAEDFAKAAKAKQEHYAEQSGQDTESTRAHLSPEAEKQVAHSQKK